jgi:hypothetical protein
MKLAKLILHFNTPELTADLCRIIPDAIVIDNGSALKFSSLKLPNEVIRFDTNLGFTRNWNRILKQFMATRSDIDAFWLMNSDIIIREESIKRIDRLINTGLYEILTPVYNCWMKQCQDHGSGTVRQINCLEITAPVITRSAFKKIGFFNDRFNLGSGVDFDFCIRALRAGVKIWADDGSSFLHLQHKTITKTEKISDYSRRANIEMTCGMRKIYGSHWKELIRKSLNINNKGIVNMKKVAVYTTIFGGYDHLHPVPKQTVQADYFCITDDAQFVKDTIGKAENSETWTIYESKVPRQDLHPRMRAKWFKVFPWECESLNEYEVTIFIDGSVNITSPDWISHCLKHLHGDLLVFKHPSRDCIYEEVEASEIMVKYKDEDMKTQIRYYKKFHPKKAGLFACTVLIRRKTDRIQRLMMSWWHENMKFTWQDQLSFPVVLRVHKIHPDVFPEDLYKNNFFSVVHHANMIDQALIANKSTPVVPSDPVLPNEGPSDARTWWMNHIINRLGYKSYLEIGLRSGDTFDKIRCEEKLSVDPVELPGHKPDFLGTSDEYFRDIDRKFDMIFIDGDHSHEQVTLDLMNSWDHLTDHGCIVLHDTNPPNERFILQDRSFTAYQVLIDILQMPEIPFELYTLTLEGDEAMGISIVFKGNRTTKDPVKPDASTLHPWYSFQQFDKHRQEISNLISPNEFHKILGAKAGNASAKPAKKARPKK